MVPPDAAARRGRRRTGGVHPPDVPQIRDVHMAAGAIDAVALHRHAIGRIEPVDAVATGAARRSHAYAVEPAFGHWVVLGDDEARKPLAAVDLTLWRRVALAPRCQRLRRRSGLGCRRIAPGRRIVHRAMRRGARRGTASRDGDASRRAGQADQYASDHARPILGSPDQDVCRSGGCRVDAAKMDATAGAFSLDQLVLPSWSKTERAA